ncbi:MAG: hypothetical protein BV456_01665 [Thermoplasmata archaeon M8B2D]|nr:MAG: hypothetical protein BV456_01665 [Thermoplasmata archaeon M8B2D]
MSYYECRNCGVDEGNFPQLYIMLNSKINWNDEYNNKFENKFREITEEVVKEKGTKDFDWNIEIQNNLGEIYKRYWNWLGDTQSDYFCSIKCAIEYLQKK